MEIAPVVAVEAGVDGLVFVTEMFLDDVVLGEAFFDGGGKGDRKEIPSAKVEE